MLKMLLTDSDKEKSDQKSLSLIRLFGWANILAHLNSKPAITS